MVTAVRLTNPNRAESPATTTYEPRIRGRPQGKARYPGCHEQEEQRQEEHVGPVVVRHGSDATGQPHRVTYVGPLEQRGGHGRTARKAASTTPVPVIRHKSCSKDAELPPGRAFTDPPARSPMRESHYSHSSVLPIVHSS